MPDPVYQFVEFQLDCGRFELMRNGKTLRIERKPMELLILLASRQNQLVTRAEIAQRLWSSEVFVDTEHGINTAIRKLRHLLRDDPDQPKFIQTVTGMGYRFVAPVSAIAPIPAIPPPGGPLDVRPSIGVETAEPDEVAPSTPAIAPAALGNSKRKSLGWYLGAGLCALLAFGGTGLYRLRHHSPEVTYTQLTDFTDSAVQPALSPDGHILAFIRGGETFLSSGQIYVKMLPTGEARRLTDDHRLKYGLAFSPDGSEISYTVIEGPVFSTYQVSALGGEPRVLMQNAAGLVWLDSHRLLFSQAPAGIHLGVVTSTLTRAGLQQVYSPAHERGMAHYSFPSPDRRWALVVEMNGNGDWSPCRLVALEGQHQTRAVGPDGGCTAAGWSPDGHWMYFTAAVQGRSHIWQQRFPEGEAEQITFGPTEEDGIAVEPEGRALITSVGVHESAIWIHDPSGDRSLSSEGEVLWWPSPVFSSDANFIYYLLRRRESPGAELWRTMLDTGKSEAVFPGISVEAFDISPDGKQVVYTTGTDGTAELWLSQLDRSSPPVKVNIEGAQSPRFGRNGQILFLRSEGASNYLEQINPDGTNISRALPYPILDFQGTSPGRRWVTVDLPGTPKGNSASLMIIPLDGGPPRRLCAGYCIPKWTTNGKYLFVPVEGPTLGNGRSLVIPIGPGETLPDFPAEGIAPTAQPSSFSGAQSVGRAGIIPAMDPDHYAWVNTAVQRNLYRISLP